LAPDFFFEAEVVVPDFWVLDFVLAPGTEVVAVGVAFGCWGAVVALAVVFGALSAAELWPAANTGTHAQASNSAQPARNRAPRISVESFNVKPSPQENRVGIEPRPSANRKLTFRKK